MARVKMAAGGADAHGWRIQADGPGNGDVTMRYDREWLRKTKDAKVYIGLVSEKMVRIPELQDRLIVGTIFNVVQESFRQRVAAGTDFSREMANIVDLDELADELIQEKRCAAYSLPVPET
jgi:hypothetical protein